MSHPIDHEITALFVLHKLILQTCMHSHPVGLDVWFLGRPLSTSILHDCMRTAKALARLYRCAGSPEPSLVAYAFAGRLCDKYHNLMSWFKCTFKLTNFKLTSMKNIHFQHTCLWIRCSYKISRKILGIIYSSLKRAIFFNANKG